MKKILLFHMNALRCGEISALCRGLEIEPEPVSPSRYGEPLGKLAGIGMTESAFAPDKIHAAGSGITSEMMVFCGLEQPEVFGFLQAMRQTGIPPVDLKAVVTPFNAMWTAPALFAELSKEHAAMRAK